MRKGEGLLPSLPRSLQAAKVSLSPLLEIRWSLFTAFPPNLKQIVRAKFQARIAVFASPREGDRPPILGDLDRKCLPGERLRGQALISGSGSGAGSLIDLLIRVLPSSMPF